MPKRFIFTKNSVIKRTREFDENNLKLVQKVHHTLTSGCTATSPEDGLLAINIARETTWQGQ
jgi:hypothetical protein